MLLIYVEDTQLTNHAIADMNVFVYIILKTEAIRFCKTKFKLWKAPSYIFILPSVNVNTENLLDKLQRITVMIILYTIVVYLNHCLGVQ